MKELKFVFGEIAILNHNKIKLVIIFDNTYCRFWVFLGNFELRLWFSQAGDYGDRRLILSEGIIQKIMHHIVRCWSTWDVYCSSTSLGFRRGRVLFGSLLSCDTSLVLLEWICIEKSELFDCRVQQSLATMTHCVLVSTYGGCGLLRMSGSMLGPWLMFVMGSWSLLSFCEKLDNDDGGGLRRLCQLWVFNGLLRVSCLGCHVQVFPQFSFNKLCGCKVFRSGFPHKLSQFFFFLIERQSSYHCVQKKIVLRSLEGQRWQQLKLTTSVERGGS